MRHFYIVRCDSVLHKLRYSKTLKGDFAGAFLGLVIGLFFGYLCLSCVGACSIDLADLTTLFWYCLLALVTLGLNLSRRRPNWFNLTHIVYAVLR
jgi:hypothetical protein